MDIRVLEQYAVKYYSQRERERERERERDTHTRARAHAHTTHITNLPNDCKVIGVCNGLPPALF